MADQQPNESTLSFGNLKFNLSLLYQALERKDEDKKETDKRTTRKKRPTSIQDKDLLETFNRSRLQRFYSILDLNLFYDTLCSLYNKSDLQKIWKNVLNKSAFPPPSASGKEPSKKDFICHILCEPTLLKQNIQEFQIISDPQNFQLYFPGYDNGTYDINHIPEFLKDTWGKPEEKRDSNIEALRKKQEEMNQLLEQKKKLDNMIAELIASGATIPGQDNPNTSNTNQSTSSQSTQSIIPSNQSQSQTSTDILTIATALTDAIKSIVPKQIETPESLDHAAAKSFLRSGKMDKVKDFKLVKPTDQIKILCFEYYEMSVIVATLDDIDNTTEQLNPIAPGIQLFKQESKLKGKGYGCEAFLAAFTTLADWAAIFAPNKAAMITRHQKILQKYKRIHSFSALHHFSNHIRQNSTGKDANWVDEKVMDEAYRFHLHNDRCDKPVYPYLTDTPIPSPFQFAKPKRKRNFSDGEHSEFFTGAEEAEDTREEERGKRRDRDRGRRTPNSKQRPKKTLQKFLSRKTMHFRPRRKMQIRT